MKASDYIVKFMIQHGITDVFGYPGGMITHLMDSFHKYREQITAHLNYHEQACAMAACGWAEITGLPGVAYATSGPGATNLLTGIACAYFESIPCIFITGQVNTAEQKGNLGVRQYGFQETDIVSMAKPVTKAAFMVKSASELPDALEFAFCTAMKGRKGPVLIDIPMDVSRMEIDNYCPHSHNIMDNDSQVEQEKVAKDIISELKKAVKPVVIAGHGISLSGTRKDFQSFIEITGIPVVTSMIAVDTLPTNSDNCYGMLGAYGLRWSNYIVNYSDCILSLGSRLDCRQTGVNKSLFAPNAKLLRVEIDLGETENKIKKDEKLYCISLEKLLPHLNKKASTEIWNFSKWKKRCATIKEKLLSVDTMESGNRFVHLISKNLANDITITTDVGQNQVWVAQSFNVKSNQRILFSGGHGAMGYSLPCAIGAAIATKKIVICFVGDGGLQMNLQELQFVVREQLPIKIILFNNKTLGMIHHFQEMYFNDNYVQTDSQNGFTVPDFIEIASAYHLRSVKCNAVEDITSLLNDQFPVLIEFVLPEKTHVYPKLGMNKPIHEQEPILSECLLKELEDLCMELE